MTEKVISTIYRPDKKAVKVPESSELSFHKGQYFKPPNINFASVSKHVRKKIVELTDSRHTIYRPTNIAKKAANGWK